MRKTSSAALALLLATGCRHVSDKDAHDFITTLTVAAESEGDDMRESILLKGCSEIPSCAAGCERALEAAATSPIADRATLIASCFDDSKAEFEKTKTHPNVWFRRTYLPQYAKRAREALPEGDRKSLDAPLARLALEK